MKGFSFKKFFAGVVSVLSLTAFLSCGADAGLGSSVDTESPKIAITYPPAAAKIRDTFIFAGTCSDDKGVKTVEVTIKNLDNSELSPKEKFYATVKDSETWSLEVNKLVDSTYELSDGKYQFDVTAYDFSGRTSGVSSRSFEIDNTAPVFVIKKPGVVKNTYLTNGSLSKYGSVFNIEGTIADDHGIASLEVKVYDKDGKEVNENGKTYVEEDVQTTGGTTVTVARYLDVAEDKKTEANKNYDEIYGAGGEAASDGTKVYSCTVTVTDDTKVYTNPEDSGSGSGNSTTNVYLYDDIYEELMSTKQGAGLTANDFKSVLNGSATDDSLKGKGAEDKTLSQVVEALNNAQKNSSVKEQSLSFSLNPNADPTYTINKYLLSYNDKETEPEASVSKAMGEQPITIIVSAGLDQTNIVPSSLKVWLKKIGRSGETTWTKAELEEQIKKLDSLEAEIQSLKAAIEKEGSTEELENKLKEKEKEETELNWTLLKDNSEDKSPSDTTVTLSTEIPGENYVESDSYYSIVVTGQDKDNVRLSQAKLYGFIGTISAVPPSVSISSPVSLAYFASSKESDGLVFKGTATENNYGMTLKGLKVTLTATDEATGTEISDAKIEVSVTGSNDYSWTSADGLEVVYDRASKTNKWTFTPEKCSAYASSKLKAETEGLMYMYTVKVEATGSGKLTASESRSVHIDHKKPVVTITSITPTVSGSEYFGSSNTNTYVNGNVSIKGSIEEQNLKEVLYDVYATDSHFEESYELTEKDSVLSELRQFIKENNLGYDLDGSMGKVYQFTQEFPTNLVTQYFIAKKALGSDKPIRAKIVLKAVDTVGNTKVYTSSDSNDGKDFIIYQETDRPKITLGNADESITDAKSVKINHNLFGTTSNNKLQISFSDDDNLAEYALYIYDEAGNLLPADSTAAQSDSVKANPYKYNPNKTTATLQYTLPSKEAKYQVKVEARDYIATELNSANPYGQKTVGNFFVAVDSGAPSIEISSPAAGSYESGTVSLSAVISKNLGKDEENKEILPKAALYMLNETTKVYEKKADFQTEKQDGKDIKESDGIYTWTATASVNTDGTYKITVDAEDSYAQKASKERIFYVDTNPPEISDPQTNDELPVKLDSTSYVSVTSAVTDSPSDVALVKYYLSKTNTVSLTQASFEEGSGWTQMNKGSQNYNASVNIKNFMDEDGTAYVYVGAVDNAGNFAVSETPLKLNLDKQAPEVKIVSHGADKNVSENLFKNNDILKITSLPYTFDAYIDDTNVPESLAEAFATRAISQGSLTDSSYENSKAVFTIDGITDEASVTVTLKAKDKNKRESELRTFVVSYDKTAPRVEIDNYASFSSSSSLELKGSVTDPNFTNSGEYLKVWLVPVQSGYEAKSAVVSFTKASQGYSWNANFSGLDDIAYNIAISAKDSFGNTSLWSTDKTKTQTQTGSETDKVTQIGNGSISIDSTPPSANVKIESSGSVLDRSKNALSGSSPYALTFGSSYYTGQTFTLRGTITETNLVLTDADEATFSGTSRPHLSVSKDGGTESIITLGGANGWTVTESSNGNYDWSYTANLSEDGSQDGSYEFKLTLFDKSKQSFTKTVTIELDTKAPELNFTSPQEGESFESTPVAKITFSDDGSGIDTSKINYTVTNITESEAGTVLTKDTDYTVTNKSASSELKFDSNFNREGTFRITAKVADYLGHESSSVSRTFYYDKAAPSVDENSITSSGKTTNGGETKTIKLSGTVSDTNALYKNGLSDNNGKTAVTLTLSGSDRKWNIPVTLTNGKKEGSWEKIFYVGSENSSETDYLSDGTYTFNITANDAAGKTTQISRTVNIDTVAPVISSASVSTQGVTTQGETWYKTTDLRIEGSASDTVNGKAGTGLKEAYYEIITNGTEWTGRTYLAGTENWAGTVSNLVSGSTKIRITVSDNAGNESHSDILGPFNIDTTAPSSTVALSHSVTDATVLNSKKKSLTSSNGAFTLDFEKIYYTDQVFTLRGNITETNIDISSGNAPSLTMSKDGGTAEKLQFTSGGNQEGEWTYLLPANSSDGEYVFTLTVKDKAGFEFSKSVTVTLDTKKPALSFTSPANEERFESAPSAKVTYSDDGVGINTSQNSDALNFTVLNITESQTGRAVSTSDYEINKGSANAAINFNPSFANEGTFKISAEVKDWLGHTSDSSADTERIFYFDKLKPSITETTVKEDGLTTNASTVTLSGTVYDTNALYKNGEAGTVKITFSKNGIDKTVNASLTKKEQNQNVTIDNESYALGNKQYAEWSYTFYTTQSSSYNENNDSSLSDGNYSFVITATDVAGKTNQLTRTVKVDTKAPEFGKGTPSESNTTDVIPHVETSSVTADGTTWYKTTDLKIAGTASDGEGTGISEVYFETSSNGTDFGGKTALAGTKSWSGTVSGLESGKTRILVTVVDNAKNSATSTVLGPFSIDTKEPVLTEGSVKIGSTDANLKAATSYLSNGDSDIFVSFEVADETGGSGIDSVYVLPYEKISAETKVAANRATLKEDGTASFTIAKANITKSGTVWARIYDKAGNYTDSNVFSITFDKDPPTVTLNNPADASAAEGIQINGKIKLSGTANDNNMLDKITRIEYSKNGSDWTDASSLMDEIDGSYSFSAANFDTTKLDDGEYFLRAVAKDTAGNEGQSKSVKVTVSQNTDRPTVKVTNITKSGSDYFLKYGTNAQISGSISDDDSTSSAVVKVFKASGKPIVLGSDGKIDESKLEGETTFTPASGEWTFTPDNKDDGSKDVYFYIEDFEGGIFYTGNTSTLNQPYFQYKTDDAEDSSDKLTYKSDSKSPVISGTLVSDKGKAFDGTAVSTTGTTLSSSYVAGGSKKNTVSFTITATDASGIAGVTADLSYVENGTTKYVKQIATGYTNKDGDKYIGDLKINSAYTLDSADFNATTSGDDTSWTWKTGEIDVSEVPTGSLTLNITPYDKAGLTGNQSYTFSVDNTAPTIVVRTPESGKEVTGSVEISGTTSDTGSAGIKDIHWIVPTTTEVTTLSKKSADERLEYLKGLKWNGGKDSLAAGTGVSAWQFNFDGKFDKTNSNTENYIYKVGNPLFTAYDKGDFAQNADDYASTSIYELPVWFKATDELGNVSVKTDFVIKHNPDWDKPKLEFTYPTTENYKSATEKFAILGGTIRATGSAEIPSGTTTVKAVYFQIADSKAGFTGTAAATEANTDSYIAKNTYGYTDKIVSAYDVINEITGQTYPPATTFTAEQLKDFGFASNDAVKAWWGIKATGTASWNIKLNEDGKLNPKKLNEDDKDKTNDITLRVCGVNAEGKFGAWTSGDNLIAIHIDNTAPVITAAVNQYANGAAKITAVPTAAATSSQTYEADMYLRGNWTLVATLLDETLVKSYAVLKGSSALTAKTDYYVEPVAKDSTTGKSGFRLYIPIDKTDASVEYTINASDADHTATQSFSFKIDEVAPTLERDKDASYDITATTPEEIQDSNYIFTLGGKSTDSGSGLERVVFYFSRNIDGTGVTKYASDDTGKTNPLNAVIFDPMFSTGSKVAMTGLAVRKFAQGNTEYELYAKTYIGKATTDEFTANGTYDSHVRIGGLVEIDGVLRKITKVDGQKVEFTPSLTQAKTTEFDAYFPIAQVIDNSAKEETKNNKDNPFNFTKGDDGDLMPESFSKTGSVWTWDASVHSTNMPDGPVNIVILAFDKAGNVTGKTIKTKITNNAPRIAKVYFGTDLSGDTKFVNSDSLQEIVEYNILGAEGKEQSTYELDFTAKDEKNRAKYSNGIFTIKNGLAVIPEFTGGNGDIAMVLDASATKAEKKTGTTAANTLIASSESGAITTTPDEDTGTVDVSVSFTGNKVNGTFAGSDSSYVMHAYVLAKDTLGADAATKGMSFTFWDSTEETVQGSTSQYSVLYVKNFKLAQTDSTAPTVVVNPFWWNSLTDNSIYDSKDASSFSDLKGHIELEKDLVITKADGTTADTELKTQLGADPKVSGKITVTGTAFDNTRLASLSVSFGSYKTAVAATYNADSSSWTVYATTLANDGYIFTVSDVQKDAKGNTKYYGNWEEDVYFGQKGHKVYWTLTLDTEKLLGTTAVAKDVILSVTATDAAGKTTVSTVTAATTDEEGKRLVTDGTTNVPTYQMDVVPYVVKVTTALSKKKKSNPSVANRTALGHYPVQTVVRNMSSAMNNNSSETVTLEGFNLNHSLVNVTGGTSVSSTASSASEMSKIMFNVASLASGEMNATVNSIPVINNLNNNDASGDSKEAGTNNSNWYNRIGNGDNNNTLTDDVIFDVWEFNDKAAVPFSGTVGGTKMKINQVSGQPNFAFTNGNLWWNMGGKVNVNGKPSGDFSSYYWSAGYDCLATVTVGFHVDEMGYTYGSGAGGDSNTSTPPAIDSYTMWVQRWGLGSQDARSTYGTSGGQVTNGAALEKVGQTEVVNGVTKYSMNKQRIQSPEFASAKNENDTNLYHAYYDAMNDEIRFKAGIIKGTKDGSTGQFVDQYCSQYGESSKEYNIDNVQVVASKSISGRGPGKYLGIAVAKDGTTDVVVMVWYDAYENQLLYSYKVNPIANFNSKDATAANWSAPKTIFDEGGEWCQIAVDAKNHIHIAAFAGDGDLKYAYLESYSTAKADIKTCTVDADGTVGEHLTLDVALDADGNSIPYIGYYSSTHKKPKYAYLVDTSAPAPAGVDESDMFTGAWEVTVVPCYSNMIVNQEEKINVGVWKYTADDGTHKKGQIKNSVTGTSSYYSVTGSSLYNGTNWSKTYGNGTQNGILAYQVQDGSGSCVETAQMR